MKRECCDNAKALDGLAFTSVFVTGTDTGVGKTMVAARLLSATRRKGMDVVPMKPVQTGCVSQGRRLVAPDLMLGLKAGGMQPSRAELADMAPYLFRLACSPHLAARSAGVTLSIPRICQCFQRLSRCHEGVIVEGAGGVLVPLNRRQTMLDLMVALDLPVILVARPGLGTLNHTLLSLQVLRGAGLEIAGVVINQSEPGPWGRIEEDNVLTIRALGRVKVLACMKYQAASRL